MAAVAAGASLVMVFSMATPGLAARVLMVSGPHISLGGGTVDLTNLAPGDNFVEPISVQNTGSVPMQLELTAATPSDVCGAPACVVGTDLKWLDFTVTGGSGNTLWTGSLADLESGVTLSPAVGPGATADFSLSIVLPLGTPDGGQGESLEFALSGTGVPIGPTTPVFVPTAPSGGGTGSGSGPTTGGGGQPPPSSGGPQLSADQSASPPVVPAGGRAGFTLTLTNNGTTAQGGVSVQDQLPGVDSLAWSLLGPGAGSHLVSPQGCALIGLSLNCTDLSVPAQSSLSIAVISSPVPIDCSVSTISNTASIAVPGSPAVTNSATASLTCVQGESISRPSPSSPPPAPKAPIVLSGQLPFTGSRLIWGAAVIALALGAVGAGLEMAGRLLAARRKASSSIG